ncbi:hypothetical protein NUU61_009358 [Penicillium alfredii]|uniref:Uncharacterized protein n=1 Tax=Penicillium alfredii TaxID=1506179 RepID=A0A9W9JWU3_9EURO|nr:uncharacterized protein NUU61_009358 [Penicillium alfredii]KAJ5084779.1 hypothetical protein NUU61_009358 [Penicillium alfredii]
MPSKYLNFAAVYRKMDEIETLETIPAADQTLLGERLAIACVAQESQQRRREPLENREYLAQTRQRKARKIYLEVLEKDPYLFLAFILTFSPRVCDRIDSRFFQQHRERKIFLSNDANLLLWQIAIKHGIDRTVHFRNLMRSIFESRPPVTGAEADGNENCSLDMCDLSAIRIAFGDKICDAIERSPTHLSKKLTGHFSRTTQCIQTKVPYDGYQDTIIRLDVGAALELADLLFPLASRKIESVLSALPPSVHKLSGSEGSLGPGNTDMSFSSEIDFAYFTLRGASVSAMVSVFGADICEGIENSELRTWEREQLLVDTTDCITMQIWRAQPQHGIIHLRIGFFAGVNLANKLYYDGCPSATMR